MKKVAGTIFRSLVLLLVGITIGLYISGRGFAGNHYGISLGGHDKVSKALNLIKNNYVDSVDDDSLQGVAINNLLQNLDPHSLYLQPQRAQSINENLDGSFTGIGLEYLKGCAIPFILHKYIATDRRLKPVLAAGDRVIEVDGDKFSGSKLTADRVNKAFRGDSDAVVSLSVLAPGSKILKKYAVRRGRVDLSSLDAAYMAAPQVGYIKISKFCSQLPILTSALHWKTLKAIVD